MLKDRSEILDAAAVKDAVDALSKYADSSAPRTQACICSKTAGVDRLENAYRSAVEKHPAWGLPNTGEEYVNLNGGGTVGIVIR